MSFRAALLGLGFTAAAFSQTAPDDAGLIASPPVAMSAAPPAYVPPTWRERTHVTIGKLFGPQAILETVPGAAFDTARGFPDSWHRTTGGFGKRMLSQYGQFAVGEGIEMGVAAFRQEDPRYHRAGSGPIGSRIKHVLLSGVMTLDSKGHRTLYVGRLANIYGSWAIASRWNPPEVRGAGSVISNGTLGLGLKIGANAFREFWPDFKNRRKKN